MTEHFTEPFLLAYLDGELASDPRRKAEEHLRDCGECGRMLARLEAVSGEVAGALSSLDVPAPILSAEELRGQLVSRALGELDAPAPGVTAQELRRQAGADEYAPEADEARMPPLRRTSRRPLLAAALVLIFVAGASAAIPGSPLREWLVRSVQTLTVLLGEPPADTSPTQRGASTSGGPAAVSVQPRDGLVRISITEPAPETLIRLRLVDRGPTSVWSVDGRYRTAPGQIEVVEAGPGEVVVLLPRSTPSARVELNGRLVAIKEGPDLRLLTPAVDSSEAEVSFQAGG